MATETEVRHSLFAKQEEFHSLIWGHRYPAYVGGIGSGKTFAGCLLGFTYAEYNPGCRGMIVAPSYKMLKRIIIPTINEDIRAQGLIKSFNRTDGIIELHGGSTIFLASCDNPESLRGPNLAWAYLDEGALADDDTWRILIGRARQPGYRQWVAVASTPKGKNWIHKRWVENPEDGYVMVKARTHDNPHLSEDYIKSLEASYSGEFLRQELYAEFVTLEGLIYTEFDRDIHVIHNYPELERYIAGVDWGYTNPAVMLTVGFDGDGRAYVMDEYYERRKTVDDMVVEARALEHEIERFYADPSEPEHIVKFQQAGLAAAKADNSVMPGINVVKAALKVKGDGRPSLYIHRSCVNTISELESYCWKKKQGEFTDQPEKQNDHAMDALRYALNTAKAPQVIVL